jgi:glycine cleavage system transcriptional repressor
MSFVSSIANFEFDSTLYTMPSEAVLIASGEDRPGILDELSQFILETGGNISASQSVNLHGNFALLLSLRADDAVITHIREGLPNLKTQGIHVEIHEARKVESKTFPFLFTASGNDRAGVLHRVSHLLQALSVNIDSLQTHEVGEGAFELRLLLAVPRDTPISMLREYLIFLCSELNITGELQEA